MGSNDEIAWALETAGERAALTLAANEVHVWAAWLAVSGAALAKFAATLSVAEQERAARFHFEQHRRRFIAGRGLLRELLARYLQLESGRIEFAYGAAGKPMLATNASQTAVQFNLAHSEDLVLIAITRECPVGIDVEKVRPLKEAEELVARFFSPHEHAVFQKLTDAEKPAAFLNLWTRKEAWLKATGEGIARSLHLVEVTFEPGAPARLLKVPDHLAQSLPWTVHDLNPARGFTAALAVAAERPIVQCRRWEEPGGPASSVGT